MSGFDPLAGSALGALLSELAETSESAVEPSFYEELRDGFAKDIVEQFNTGAVVLIKATEVQQGADPHNPFASDTAARRTPRNAVVTGFPTAEIKGAILESDRRVLIDAAGFTDATRPDASTDSIEIDGTLHAIVSVKAVPAAGPAVVYIIQART